MFRYILSHFVPRETNDGNTAGDNGGDGAGNPSQDGRPSWLPEKFFDAETKTPLTEQLATSYRELEGKVREKDEAFMTRAQEALAKRAPEAYKVGLPEGFQMPEGLEFNLTSDDPLVSWFSGIAKQSGMSQEQFDNAIKSYLEMETAGYEPPAAKIAKLGEKGKERLEYVQGVLVANLSEEEYGTITSALSSAEGVIALEKLIDKLGARGPGEFQGEGQSTAMPTDDELKAMMDDPRYFNDASYAAMVTRKWEAKYKGQTQKT